MSEKTSPLPSVPSASTGSRSTTFRFGSQKALVRSRIEDDIGLTALHKLIDNLHSVAFCAAHPAICSSSSNSTTVITPSPPPVDLGGGTGGGVIQHPPGWKPHPILFE
jgi:hypothetical protein